jgi:hypothetical protein
MNRTNLGTAVSGAIKGSEMSATGIKIEVRTLWNTRRYPKYSGLLPASIQQLRKREAPVPKGQTVNSGFYCDVLRRLRGNVRRRRPELWWEQTWQLHHDNAPSHTSVFTQPYMAKYKMTVIPTYCTPLIWHPVTSFVFQKLNWRWQETGLLSLRKSRPNPRVMLDTPTEKDFQEAC